jgi:hypothetical protein
MTATIYLNKFPKKQTDIELKLTNEIYLIYDVDASVTFV